MINNTDPLSRGYLAFPKEEWVLCLSGGIDSIIAYYYLNQPKAVYFNTGVPYTKKELNALSNLGIPFIEDHSLKFDTKDIYVPHRNLLFASRASQYGSVVFMAGLADDMVEDKTPKAFDIMAHCLTVIGKKPVSVYSPFWDYAKEDAVRWFMANNGHAESILKISSSCYSDSDHQCMECPACFRKAVALFANGINIKFKSRICMEQYRVRAFHGYYTKSRNESILKYVEWMNGK